MSQDDDWREWMSDVRAVEIDVVATAMGFEPASGRGTNARYALAHNGCYGVHGDGEPTVFTGTRAGRLVCRSCGESFSGLDLIAMGNGLNPASLSSDDWAQVRADAASRGWCAPDPREEVDFDRDRWRRARAERATADMARRSAVEAARREHAIDVQAAWLALRGTNFARDAIGRWAMTSRGVPADLLPHLPWSDLTAAGAIPQDAPDGVSLRGWREARRLLAGARRCGRLIVIAQRDAEGLPVGASRRWAGRLGPPDGGPKALALSAKAALAGPPSGWTGGVAIFGDLPMALARVRRGEPLYLVEGGPDWIIAHAATRYLRRGAALGAPGASSTPKIAAALWSALWEGPPPERIPEVVIIPDRGDTGERAAWAAAEELVGQASTAIRSLPAGHDDLNDFARTTDAAGVAAFMTGARCAMDGLRAGR